MSVRVRFAPSPTGFLHIGGVRTALFNWLYARRHGGKYLIRIEDTDRERSQEMYTHDILDSLQWLGLSSDEEILYQSQRQAFYEEIIGQLLKHGAAYRCYCSSDEIEAMREEARRTGAKPKYNGRCRERSSAPTGAPPSVVRLKVPQEGSVSFNDLIHGTITVQNAELDDFVIQRSDGAPTYNLVVVADDQAMQITHVIRGDDHINNTSKQVHVFRALNYQLPQFAHLPMILGEDKKKLSKRHGTVSATSYREQGYLPHALLNFMARLGWSLGDQEIISIKEMIENFDFDHVNKSAAVFNTEKLQWLNSHYIKESSSSDLLRLLHKGFGPAKPVSEDVKTVLASPFGQKVVELLKPKVKVLTEMLDQLQPLSQKDLLQVDTQSLKWNKKTELKPPTLAAAWDLVSSFEQSLQGRKTLAEAGLDHDGVGAVLNELASKHGLKLGEMLPPIRLCVTGPTVGVGLFDILPIMPWEQLKPRLLQVQNL